MSLATLKKKASTKYSKNIGEPGNGFSLQGKLRIYGTSHNTNLARSVTRTPFKGNYPVGHGGLYGKYDQQVALNGRCCVPQTTVKSSTLSTKGMLQKKLLCCNTTVTDNSLYHIDQSKYIENKQQKELQCTSINYAINHKTCYQHPSCKASYTKTLPYDKSSSEYIQSTVLSANNC
tara:strand:+ start:464 stop:991 length:528 start_codon:yes stop_codon:yes gene_type:complete